MRIIAVLLLTTLTFCVNARSILTQGVDPNRNNWNNQETILNPSNVKSLSLLATIPTVSACTTQLLYYENLNLRGHKNVLFCSTNPDRDNGNATIYAFDADSFQEIWQLYIGQAAVWTTAAPAIDSSTNIMYFIYKNDNDNGYNYLIAVNIMTGQQMPDSPKLINATVPGTGDASVNGQLAFQNTLSPDSGHRIHQDSRTSMLILNGVLYFGFAHNSDSYPYHGWVFAYRYSVSQGKFDQVAHFCVTPNDGLGGVWQAGQGIMTDGNSLYFTTGNGNFDPNKSAWSMAVIKMSPQLQVQDYFVPAKWKPYSDADLDLGGCGPAFIPNTKYIVVAVTKYGGVHLIDSTNMGKFNGQQDSCRQTFSLANNYIVPGGNPVAWDTNSGDANAIKKVYAWAPSLNLVQFNYNPSKQLMDNPISWTADHAGGGLFVSSNGNNDAVLWAYGGRGTLYAFDASKDVSAGPIWFYRNIPGPQSWQWPTVVNGKVYVPASDNKIYVFGLK